MSCGTPSARTASFTAATGRSANCVAPYEAVLAVVREYFGAKGKEASNKYFVENSKAAYRWVAR